MPSLETGGSLNGVLANGTFLRILAWNLGGSRDHLQITPNSASLARVCYCFGRFSDSNGQQRHPDWFGGASLGAICRHALSTSERRRSNGPSRVAGRPVEPSLHVFSTSGPNMTHLNHLLILNSIVKLSLHRPNEKELQDLVAEYVQLFVSINVYDVSDDLRRAIL